ncbi:MAG: hypothetical protein ACW99A_22185, partial [Candidatus Kariarchaeaceae archaeon]
FQLGADILSTNSKTFTLKVSNDGLTNGQPAANIKVAVAEYNETYMDWLPASMSADFNNGTHNAPAVDEVGDVAWIETDWGILAMFVDAGWRQSSWKHIYMKDQNWDVLMAQWNVSGTAQEAHSWQWTKAMHEGDFGWHNGNLPDTVTISKVGPVRAVVQTESAIGYNGQFGIATGIHAARTFTFYNGMPGIAQNIRLVGPDAVAASEDMTALYGGPLDFATKILDFNPNTTTTPWTARIGSNGFDTIYSPGGPNQGGNQSRYQPVDTNRRLNLSLVTEPYFGMFNASGYGYAVYWGHIDYKNNLLSLDWSHEELAIRYSFNQFPLGGINRLLLPFSNAANANTTIDGMVANWTGSFDLDFTSYLRDPWVSIQTETETETETSTDTSTVVSVETTTEISEVTEVTTDVQVSTVEVPTTKVETTTETAAPGFEVIYRICYFWNGSLSKQKETEVKSNN